jgi:hypothetical protein
MIGACLACLWIHFSSEVGAAARRAEPHRLPAVSHAATPQVEPLEGVSAEVVRLRQEVHDLAERLRRVEQAPLRLPAPSPEELPPPAQAPSPADSQGLLGEPQEFLEQAPNPPWLAFPPATAAPEAASTEGGYGEGSPIVFWGWLSYLATPQAQESTFWAWEAELDLTHSFTDRLAASADIDFVDTNDGAWPNLEQLFLSMLFPEWNDAIFTAGKFNAPYGIERRDFWDRRTGSDSLLFDALPQDLTGVMWTQPWGATGVTFRAFVVNGFNHNLDINQQPSLGLMAEFQPSDDLHLALTNYCGPEFAGNTDDKLYFVLPQVTWWASAETSLSAEFLRGITQSPVGRLDWTGYALIVSHTLTDRWRLFGQWSDLNDAEGFFGAPLHGQQASAGVAWYPHPFVEGRAEYRHDIERNPDLPGDNDAESDSVSAHLTFGY